MNAKQRLAIGLGLIGMLIAAGCGRVTGVTELRADGSFDRKLKFVVQEMPSDNGGKIEDVLALPKGVGWKVNRTEKDGEVTVTAERTFIRGEVSNSDIAIKKKEGLRARNEVRVREIAPGRLEYVETFKWLDKPPRQLSEPRDEVIKIMRDVLSEAKPTDQELEKMTVGFARLAWRVMFGPGDPLIGTLLTHQDLFERRLRQRVGEGLIQLLGETFGDRLPEARRTDVARQLLLRLDSEQVFGDVNRPPDSPEQAEDTGGLIAIFMAVKVPGRIIETNGEVDRLSGEVFWALYPEAAALGDVELRVVVETGPAK